jgi:hypothetical protein
MADELRAELRRIVAPDLVSAEEQRIGLVQERALEALLDIAKFEPKTKADLVLKTTVLKTLAESPVSRDLFGVDVVIE